MNDILLGNQFGFRRLHSSYMALMIMVNEITRSLDNVEHVVGIFLDFSKAFDTVNHTVLLKKLYHYGIRENALEWFESYLSGRQQNITYNGYTSSTKYITCGVPQGSILGPLLFFLFISMIYKRYVIHLPRYCLLMIQICFIKVMISPFLKNRSITS